MKNFLYLYGPNGVDKTRLLRMMETKLNEQVASGDVVRIGAETLVEERMLMRLFRDRRSSGKLTVVASDLVNIDNEIVELFDDAVVIDLGRKTPPDQRIANPAAFICREFSIVSGWPP